MLHQRESTDVMKDSLTGFVYAMTLFADVLKNSITNYVKRAIIVCIVVPS